MKEERKGQVGPGMAFIFQLDKLIEGIHAHNLRNYSGHANTWLILGLPWTGQNL